MRASFFVRWDRNPGASLAAIGAALWFGLVSGVAAQFRGPDGTVFPQAPQAFEQVWVTFFCFDLERCAGGSVSMSGNTITVVRYQTSCLVCNYPTRVFVELGQFPAGTYTVKIVNANGFVRSTQQLTVTDPNPPGPYNPLTLPFPFGNYTDEWWDPDEPGWGIAITQHVDGVIFAVWAVYGPDNKPIWYTLQPGGWTSYNTYTGPVYRTTGPYFGGNYADGRAVVESLAGSATLAFTDPATGTLQFNVDGVSRMKAISRLNF